MVCTRLTGEVFPQSQLGRTPQGIVQLGQFVSLKVVEPFDDVPAEHHLDGNSLPGGLPSGPSFRSAVSQSSRFLVEKTTWTCREAKALNLIGRSEGIPLSLTRQAQKVPAQVLGLRYFAFTS
jgi:hypothetical protein